MFDSLLNQLTPKPKPANVGQYLMVVESQRYYEDALQDLGKLKWMMNDSLDVVKSKSGRWYYVVLKSKIKKQEVQNALKETRNKIPDAWYIHKTEIEESPMVFEN